MSHVLLEDIPKDPDEMISLRYVNTREMELGTFVSSLFSNAHISCMI